MQLGRVFRLRGNVLLAQSGLGKQVVGTQKAVGFAGHLANGPNGGLLEGQSGGVCNSLWVLSLRLYGLQKCPQSDATSNPCGVSNLLGVSEDPVGCCPSNRCFCVFGPE